MEKVLRDAKGRLRSFPEIMYQFYSSDARAFIAGQLKEMLDTPPPSLRNLHPALQKKANELLILELVAKFCESAEDLAAFAISFATELYMDAISPEEVWKKLAEYETGEIVNFYRDIQKRPPKYFANLHGLPPLHMQKLSNQAKLLRSSKQLAIYLNQVSDMYLKLRELHNSYKHGMRVFPGSLKDNRTGKEVPALSYVDNDANAKAIAFPTDSEDELCSWCVRIGQILDTMLQWHKIRIDTSKKRKLSGQLHLFGKTSDEKRELKDLFFPGLFDVRKYRVAEAERIAEKNKQELAGIPYGHVVAIDIDLEEILPDHSPDLRDVLWKSLERRPGANLVFRRMTKDGRVGPY